MTSVINPLPVFDKFLFSRHLVFPLSFGGVGEDFFQEYLIKKTRLNRSGFIRLAYMLKYSFILEILAQKAVSLKLTQKYLSWFELKWKKYAPL